MKNEKWKLWTVRVSEERNIRYFGNDFPCFSETFANLHFIHSNNNKSKFIIHHGSRWTIASSIFLFLTIEFIEFYSLIIYNWISWINYEIFNIYCLNFNYYCLKIINVSSRLRAENTDTFRIHYSNKCVRE